MIDMPVQEFISTRRRTVRFWSGAAAAVLAIAAVTAGASIAYNNEIRGGQEVARFMDIAETTDEQLKGMSPTQLADTIEDLHGFEGPGYQAEWAEQLQRYTAELEGR